MPVIDTPSHPSTIHNDMRYTACQNKVRKDGYWKLVTFFDREFPYQKWQLIEDAFFNDPRSNSRCCRYMDYETDAGCSGCLQPKDVSYIEKMKELV